MTRSKPTCPSCKSVDHVRTLGGGTHNKYRYICDSCDSIWQQTPPHKECMDVSTDLSIMKQNLKRPINYKCGKCGLPKKGHVCLSNTLKAEESRAVEVLVSNTYQPASTAFQGSTSENTGATSMTSIPLPSGESVMVPFSAYQNL